MADKDNRYVVTFEAYVYAPNDYMARKELIMLMIPLML